MFKRKPDVIIGEPDDPYLLRWWVIPRNPWFNIYLHKIVKDDEDRALHDHPWVNCSILLTGGYLEVAPDKSWRAPDGIQYFKSNLYLRRYPWLPYFRKATAAHRIVLLKDYWGKPIPVWSLFITGPWQRNWGFWCPRRWVPWQEFCEPTNSGQVGKGCGES